MKVVKAVVMSLVGLWVIGLISTRVDPVLRSRGTTALWFDVLMLIASILVFFFSFRLAGLGKQRDDK